MKDEDFFENFDFCCSRMAANITLEENRQKMQVVLYHPEIRVFSLPVIGEKNAFSPIKYCPYCGKKLPKDLQHEWSQVIDEKFGKDFLKSAYCKERKLLPKEFQTDEWWKKRGL